MKYSKKRFINILLSMVFIAAALFIYSFFLVQTFQTAKALRGEVEAKRQLYKDQLVAIKRVKTLLAQFEENLRLQETLNSILPVGNAELPAVVAQINGLAKLNGVILDKLSIRFGPIGPAAVQIPLAAGIGKATVEFGAEGSYESLKGFLAMLENNIRIMDVMNLDAEILLNEQNLLRMAFKVDVYYQAKSPR